MTEESIQTLWGHLAPEEPAKLYAVLDGASVPDLLPKLYDIRPEFECLYRGELAPDLAEVAPYLVRVEPGTDFADWLVAAGWGEHWGVFAQSDSDLRVLRRHLRTFLTVYDPNGRPMLFRYYDPRVLRLYLPTCNAEELRAVFGPVSCYLLEDEDPNRLLEFRLDSDALRRETRALAATA